MQMIKPGTLGLLARPRLYEGAPMLVVSVCCGFTLTPSPTLLQEAALWPILDEEGVLHDEGWPKPSGEMLLQANAYAPPDTTVQGMIVRAQVGAIDKTLRVFGSRKAGGLQTPTPFSMMPINWENTYGGETDMRNPLGRGAPSEEGERVLPNIVPPESVVDEMLHQPQPASFAPVDPSWEPRRSLVGPIEPALIEASFGGMPIGTRPAFYYRAQPDQRLPQGFWAGGEAYTLEGMHPTKTHLAGTLPAIRFRVTVAGQEDHYAPPCPINTVWLIPHREIGLLLGHAVLRIQDPASILAVAAGYENLADTPRPDTHYRAALARSTDPEKRWTGIQCEQPLVPLQTDAPMLLATTDEETRAALRAEIAQDPATLSYPEEPPRAARPPQSAREQVEAMLATLPAGDASILPMHQSRAMTAPDAESLAAVWTATGIDEADAKRIATDAIALRREARAADTQMTIPSPRPASESATLRNLLQQARDNATPLAHLNFAGASLSGFDFGGMRLDGIDLRGADLHDCVFNDASLVGALLAGADLSNAQGQRADLSGANLYQATLTAGNWSGANFAGTNCREANAQECVLREIMCSNTYWYATQLTGADCSGADCSGSSFEEVNFSGAILSNTILRKAVFIACTLADVQAEAAIAESTTFLQTCAPRSRWRGAQMRSVLIAPQSDWHAADFSEAFCETANLRAVDFTDSIWTKAHLVQANLTGACLCRATLKQTNLSASLLTGADCHDVDAPQVNLQGANLQGGNLRNAKLPRANLYGANLIQTQRTGLDTTGAITYKTILTVEKES